MFKALSCSMLCMLMTTADAVAAECDRVEVELISGSQPASRDPGDPFNEFDDLDDHAIYHSAADWLHDPDTGLFLDGTVDFNFGMNFGNAGLHPEGFDRQVKQLHEYRMSPAYDAGITSTSLVSATIEIVVDGVLDMGLSGQTDLVGPEWMYVNVFAGDGLLTTLADAQIDYDRCDRMQPATWDVVHHLVDNDGLRITQDGVDANGGEIVLNIDVASEVQALLAGTPDFAGFSMAGSGDGEFVLLSVDGGSGTFAQLPRLFLVGPALGDFDETETVDLLDFATFQECFTGSGNATTNGCTITDLDQDTDVDNDDLALLAGNLNGPDDQCTMGSSRRQITVRPLSGNDPDGSMLRTRFFGDFNDDGELDGRDRDFFMGCVDGYAGQSEEQCSTADLNKDGNVDARDLRIFRAIFEE